MTTDQIIDERVHREMWSRRMTQTRLGATLGMSQTAISKKLRGERPWYAGEVLAVATTLGVSVASLYGVDDASVNPTDGPTTETPTVEYSLANVVPIGANVARWDTRDLCGHAA